MSEIREKREGLGKIRRTIGQSAFVLKENPELTFPQIYNRSQRKAKKIESLRNKLEEERNKFKKPWLQLISDPKDSLNCVQTLSGHKADVYFCAFSPNGKMIISASSDEKLRIWDADMGMEISAHEIKEDGKLVISAGEDKFLKVWDSIRNVEIHTLKGHTQPVVNCTFSPDGKHIIYITETELPSPHFMDHGESDPFYTSLRWLRGSRAEKIQP